MIEVVCPHRDVVCVGKIITGLAAKGKFFLQDFLFCAEIERGAKEYGAHTNVES